MAAPARRGGKPRRVVRPGLTARAAPPAMRAEQGRTRRMPEIRVKSEISGSVWKILKQPGEAVEEEEPVILLESMKMEIPVMAPRAGKVAEIRVEEGEMVAEGDVVAVIVA
jgi:acetyl-CoA carboxylase biotin carboxyl carrier protein